MSEIVITASASADLDVIRHRLADAPQWARQSIDGERQRRGLPTIWEAVAGTKAVRPPAKRITTRPARCLVGLAAPGLSTPHVIGSGPGGREPLPEVISRSAWRGIERALARGARFDFRRKHDGKPFASSSDPDVEIVFDGVVGMIFILGPEASLGFEWPAGGYCSLGFTAARWTPITLRDGRRIRRIDAMKIEHIALLGPADEPPAYKAAVVASCDPTSVHRTRARVVSEALGRIAEMLPR